jgi:hypothetical protein
MLTEMAVMTNLAKDADGIIVSSSHAVDGPVLDALQEFKKTYPVGIQVAPFAWEKGAVIRDEKVQEFLDRHERNSVIYISFGYEHLHFLCLTPLALQSRTEADGTCSSHFFPVNTPEYVEALLDTLTGLEFPFIVALGGPSAANSFPAEAISRINASGKGLIPNGWVDQRGILQHPSTGWFLTHAGWNSISESLAQGVPMICWPMSHGDQFMDAALLSTREEPVAFELLQIRMNEARGPPRRGGERIKGDVEDVKKEMKDVLEKARGAEGLELRKHAQSLALRLRNERDGIAEEVIRELAEI